jgi:pilus assembly protein CpaE
MELIKLLIADDKEDWLNNVKRMLLNMDDVCIIGLAKSGEEALEKIAELQPHIVIINADIKGINGLQITEKITMEYPHIQSIIMSTKSSPEYFRDAMKAGAKDYLIEPFSNQDLAEAIHNVYTKWLKDKAELFAEESNAKVISFFSTKGGVGRTTLAVNLASALASRDKKTLLIDASLQFGDVALTLDLRPKYTISDVVEKNEFTDDGIKRRITKHSSGLDVLAAPKEPALAEAISAKNLQEIIDVLKPSYQYIIIDMTATITEKELAILDKTSLLFLVATLEITSLKNTKTLLKTLQDIKYDLNKVKILLNKDTPDVGIDKTSLEAGLGISVYATIPMDSKLVQVSLNKGESFVLKSPCSQISRSVIEIAEKLIGPSRKTVEENTSAIVKLKNLIFGS